MKPGAGRSAIVTNGQGYLHGFAGGMQVVGSRPPKPGDRVGLLLDLTGGPGCLTVLVNDALYGRFEPSTLSDDPHDFATPPLTGPLCWVVEFGGGEGSARIERKPVPDVPDPAEDEEEEWFSRIVEYNDRTLETGEPPILVTFSEDGQAHVASHEPQELTRLLGEGPWTQPDPRTSRVWVPDEDEGQERGNGRDAMTWDMIGMLGVEDFYEEMLAEGGTMDDVREDIFERVGMRL
eukprot:COSAG04_NODE_1810_length_5515_cov_6.783419_5_plen_235_part_00